MPIKLNKNLISDSQIKAMFIIDFHELLLKYPDVSIVSHLQFILRRRKSEGKSPFEWSDKELLNKLSEYSEERKELDNEQEEQ